MKCFNSINRRYIIHRTDTFKMNSYASIYIPRICAYHTEDTVGYIMDNYMVGTVSYVDFTPINKKPGFDEDVDNVVKSAFIHFSIARNIEFWNVIETGEAFKLRVNKNEYWLCLKNKNPVKRTLMNIHQVVENGRHLENLIGEQANKIQLLEERIENKDSVIRQFIVELFCNHSQKGISKLLRDVLDGNALGIKPRPENTHKLDSCTTTRQGDEIEKRLEILEKFMFETQVNRMRNNNRELHSSEKYYNNCHNGHECEDDTSNINSDIFEKQEQMRELREMAKQEKIADKINKEDRWTRRQK